MTAPALAASLDLHTSSAAALFFRLLYERRQGYLELAWIDGDPDDREHCVFDRTWFRYVPEHLGELLGRVEELSEQYGNVYVSAQLYTAPRRSAPTLPGRVVFVDDLQDGVACSFNVQTSPDRRHGYFLLDQFASPEKLRELARRAAYSLGGDKGGWDSQQLVRVPGTFNTKARHGGHHLVTLQMGTRRRYSDDELRAAWPEISAPEAELADMDWPEVERWLGNLGALIGENGLPRRVRPTTQTAQVLQGEPADTSLARYMVAKGLVLHGYPDAELTALLWHLCAYDSVAAKGSAWLKTDILRIIAKVRAECPRVQVNPTRARGKGEPQTIVERRLARRGRKAALTPQGLFAWYESARDCGDLVMLTVAQVAEQLQVSRATVERCERALRAEGQIERRTFNRRQASLVALLRPAQAPQAAACPEVAPPREPRPLTIDATPPATSADGAERRPLTIADEPVSTPVEADETRPLTIAATGSSEERAGELADRHPLTIASETSPATAANVPSTSGAGAQQDAENSTELVVGGTHAPQGTLQPAPRVTPREAVAAAFDHFASRRRISRQMVVMFLDSAHPELAIADQALNRLITAERRERAWAQQVEQLRTMRPSALKRLSRMVDRVLEEGPGGPRGQQHPWACAIYPYVVAELDRRSAIRDAIDPDRQRREREELLCLADQALRKLREGQRRPQRTLTPPQAGAPAGLCPPQPAPAQRELFSDDTAEQPGVAGLVARLKRLKQERDGLGGVCSSTAHW